MWTADFAPDNSSFVWFTTWSFGLVLTSVNVSNSFTHVKSSVLFGSNTFNTKKSYVFMLISQTTLITSEYGLAPESVVVRHDGRIR